MTEETQDYITLDEAARELGMKKGSLYHYIRALKIEVQTYPLNRYGYIAKTDVERIREQRTHPWKVSKPKAREEENNGEKAA